jgi:hypothetical protein
MLSKIITVIVLAVVLTVVINALPDIRRYLRIRAM